MAKRQQQGSLSDILLARHAVDGAALKIAEEEARNDGVPLEKHLVDNQLVADDMMTLAVSEYLDMPPISLARFSPDSQLVELIPREILTKHLTIPIAKTAKSLTVALGDPFDIVAVEELCTLTGLEITPLAAMASEVKEVLSIVFAEEAGAVDMEGIMNAGDEDDDADLMLGAADEVDSHSLEDMMESAEEGPVIRMVNMILVEAIRIGASDIFIEPQEDDVRLRYRVDGVCVERPSLPKNLQSAIISRVKIMSELDIGEHRIPQDGRFRITTMGKSIDIRVSILPTIFGGRIVMRTLDKSSLFANLGALNLDPRALEAMRYAIAQPHGIILVTGPTGSGKTTTLYSCLQELNKPDINLVTCEDPVEYQIPGLIQVKINAEVGCTFAAALRAILRQDPDIVLIGEIRDGETCEIAIKAALTGHLVLSTLHANDAPSTVTRLLDMGMEPFLLASSVILAQAQRLYRRLCPTCKKKIDLPLDYLKKHKIDPDFFEGKKIYKAVGCPKCHNIGYKGRGAAMEVLPIDEKIRECIIQQMMVDDIRDMAVAQGMVTLQTVGLERVKSGETSLEAAMRMAGSES
jgi:type IV pilus assembly protein PilB